MNPNVHASLMAESSGYREFVGGFARPDPEDIEDFIGFAEWLVGPLDPVGDFSDTPATTFLAEWNHWNS